MNSLPRVMLCKRERINERTSSFAWEGYGCGRAVNLGKRVSKTRVEQSSDKPGEGPHTFVSSLVH